MCKRGLEAAIGVPDASHLMIQDTFETIKKCVCVCVCVHIMRKMTHTALVSRLLLFLNFADHVDQGCPNMSIIMLEKLIIYKLKTFKKVTYLGNQNHFKLYCSLSFKDGYWMIVCHFGHRLIQYVGKRRGLTHKKAECNDAFTWEGL